MTGDARRLLAWKGLGGTPATVFTITFPPTVAERHRETNYLLGHQQLSNVSHVSTYQPGWLCPQWHFLWLQPAKHETNLCKSLHFVKVWKHFGGRCFNSHQNSRIGNSSRSGHCGSLRDLSLTSSGSLSLARCSLDLWRASLLLLGQLLGLLLLCKSLKKYTQST